VNNQANIGMPRKSIFLNIWAVTGLLFFTFVLLFLSLNSSLALPVLGIALGIPFFYVIIKYPKVWLWAIALSSFVFFRTSDLKIGVGDILFGVFIVASTYIWLMWKLFVQREKLVESIADWFIIVFYTGMLLNSVVAMLNGAKFLDWFREYALYSNMLLYFPFKYYLKEKKDIIIILVMFGLSVFIASFDQIRMYKEIALSQTIYAYQLGRSVRLNQPLFSAAIFFSLIMSLLPMRKIYRLALWGLAFAAIAALVVSFSRSFWVFVIFGIILIFFYLVKRQKKIIVVALGLIILTGTVSFFSFFGEKADLMIVVLTERFTSTTKGSKDVSLKLRLVEYEEALKKIAKHPLFGNGLGKHFHFYVPFLHITTYTQYIHSGYLYALYRFGIPLTFMFLFILGYNIFVSERMSRKLKDPFYKNLILSSMISLLMLAAASIFSNQFFQRDSGIILALAFSFVSIAQKKYKQELIS